MAGVSMYANLTTSMRKPSRVSSSAGGVMPLSLPDCLIDKAIKIQESNAISAQGGDLPYDRADYLRTAKILKTTRLNIEAQ